MEPLEGQTVYPDQLKQTLALWDQHGAITPELEARIISHFDSLVEGVLALVEQQSQDPLRGLEALMLLFAIVNSCSPPTKYRAVAKLGKYTKRVKDKVSKIADDAGASEYTISVGVPLGFSLAVTFPSVGGGGARI